MENKKDFSKVDSKWGNLGLAEDGFFPMLTFFISNYHKLGLDGADQAILVVLLSQHESFNPSQSVIAERTGFSKTTIKDRLKKMYTKGILKPIREKVNGMNKFNKYDFSGLFKQLHELKMGIKVVQKDSDVTHKVIMKKYNAKLAKAEKVAKVKEQTVLPEYEEIEEVIPPKKEYTPRFMTWEELSGMALEVGFSKDDYDTLTKDELTVLCYSYVGSEFAQKDFMTNKLETKSRQVEESRIIQEAQRLELSSTPHIGKARYDKYDNEDEEEVEFLAEKAPVKTPALQAFQMNQADYEFMDNLMTFDY